MNQKREDVRNVAIIAHVDHGKTTLVDELLKQSGVFRTNQEVAERVMDSNAIERERGITILSKNTAVTYNGTKINIIDTPGHADFGGEVERVLKMVNGVILVVDAFESSAMPQTRFVLGKALELQLPVIVCVNKCDRPEARPLAVQDEVLELFLELDATDEQLDCPFVFASAKNGSATTNITVKNKDMKPLFDTILDYIPAPEGDPDAGLQLLISTIDYNEYVGRIGVGKVDNGKISVNQDVVIVNHHNPDSVKRVKVSKLYEFDGLNKVEVREAGIGSIVAISGITDIHIGDTLCAPERPEAIPFQKISEPTIAMHFMVNDSPLAGREGKFITSCHLEKNNCLKNSIPTFPCAWKRPTLQTALKYPDAANCICLSSSKICAAKAMNLQSARQKSFIIMTKKDTSSSRWNRFISMFSEEFAGNVIEKLGQRKGELVNMTPGNGGTTVGIFRSCPAVSSATAANS